MSPSGSSPAPAGRIEASRNAKPSPIAKPPNVTPAKTRASEQVTAARRVGEMSTFRQHGAMFARRGSAPQGRPPEDRPGGKPLAGAGATTRDEIVDPGSRGDTGTGYGSTCPPHLWSRGEHERRSDQLRAGCAGAARLEGRLRSADRGRPDRSPAGGGARDARLGDLLDGSSRRDHRGAGASLRRIPRRGRSGAGGHDGVPTRGTARHAHVDPAGAGLGAEGGPPRRGGCDLARARLVALDPGPAAVDHGAGLRRERSNATTRRSRSPSAAATAISRR